MLVVIPRSNAMEYPKLETAGIIDLVSELTGITDKEYLLEASLIEYHFSEEYGNNSYEMQIVLGNFNNTRHPLELFKNSTPVGDQVIRAVTVLEPILNPVYKSSYNLSVTDLVLGGVYFSGSVIVKDGKLTVDDAGEYILDVMLRTKNTGWTLRFYGEKLGFIHIIGHVKIQPSELVNNTELLHAILNRESLINESLLPNLLELVEAGEKIFGDSQENWFTKVLEWISSDTPNGYSLNVDSDSISLKRTLKVNFRLGSEKFTLNLEHGLCAASVKSYSGYDSEILISHSTIGPRELSTLEQYVNENTFDAKEILEKVLNKAKSEGLDVNKFKYASFADISLKGGDLVVHIYLSYGDPFSYKTPLYSAYYNLNKDAVSELYTNRFFGDVAPIEFLSKGTIINLEDLNDDDFDLIMVGKIVGFVAVPIAVGAVLYT